MMASFRSLAAILAIASGASGQYSHHYWQEKVHTGPAPASLSSFFASESSATAAGLTTLTTLPAGGFTPTPTAGGGPPVTNTSPAATGGATGMGNSNAGDYCIDFTSDNPDWYYSNSAPWTGSGTFGSLSGGQICVPRAAAGGAMYIGTSASPGAGNTKLECYFPTDTTQQSNCDISLVDGYSLSVTCTMAGASMPQIGGSVDLFTSGNCPGGDQGGVCKNTKAYNSAGYTASQAGVDPFFQPAIVSPNNYCIWWACTQDSFFNSNAAMSCHVSAGTPAARKRDAIAGEAPLVGETKGGKHAHGGYKHPRSIGQVLA